MRVGAYDFIEKPFSSEHIAGRVTRAVEKRRLTLEVQGLRAALRNWQGIEALVLGKSPAIESRCASGSCASPTPLCRC